MVNRRIKRFEGFSEADLKPIQNFESGFLPSLGSKRITDDLPIPDHLSDIKESVRSSRKLNDEEYLRTHGIDRSLSASRVPWTEPRKSIKENHNRRAERDRYDEMALRANFATKNPDIDTIRRRAKHRENLDYHCLPEGQVFLLLTTYGPDKNLFDIEADHVGFRPWGVFETLQECEEHVALIRETNPHAVFFDIHSVQLGKVIDLPPPTDGNTNMHHLNKHHHDIMKRHLRRSVAEAEYVEDRKQETLDHARQKNKATEEFNKLLKQAVTDVAMSGKTWDKLKDAEEVDRAAAKIERLPSGKQHTKTASRDTLEEQSKLVKAVPPNLLESYLQNMEANNMSLPQGYRVVYKRFTNEDGKEVVARIIQARKQKQ
jgi:hypothetical protein